MSIEIREFEALGGKFSDEKLVRRGFRYQLYIGKLTIGNAKCIGYVKKLDNGAVIVTKMKNISENSVVDKLHTVNAVLEHYFEKEERNEEILELQSKRKLMNFFAMIFQFAALALSFINIQHFQMTFHPYYLMLACAGIVIFLLMCECRYRIQGAYLLRRKNM